MSTIVMSQRWRRESQKPRQHRLGYFDYDGKYIEKWARIGNAAAFNESCRQRHRYDFLGSALPSGPSERAVFLLDAGQIEVVAMAVGLKGNLELHYVRSLKAFGAFVNRKLDSVPFVERFEA